MESTIPAILQSHRLYSGSLLSFSATMVNLRAARIKKETETWINFVPTITWSFAFARFAHKHHSVMDALYSELAPIVSFHTTLYKDSRNIALDNPSAILAFTSSIEKYTENEREYGYYVLEVMTDLKLYAWEGVVIARQADLNLMTDFISKIVNDIKQAEGRE